MKTLKLKVVKDWETADGSYKLHKGDTALCLPEIQEPTTYRIALDVGVTASIPKEYFESPLIAGLREYLDNATPEQLKEDWEELEPFNGFGPDAAEYLQNQYDKNILTIINAYKEWVSHEMQIPMLNYIKEKLRDEN